MNTKKKEFHPSLCGSFFGLVLVTVLVFFRCPDTDDIVVLMFSPDNGESSLNSIHIIYVVVFMFV